MNKLFVVLLAGTFVLASGSALAEDKTPAQRVDQAKPKADTDANARPSGPYEAWTVEDAHRLDRELSTNRKAEKDAAKAAAAKMTPEEKVLARKAKRAKKQQEYSGIEGAARARTLEDAATAPSGRRPDYDQLHRRYLEPLPPERWPVKREPAKSNP